MKFLYFRVRGGAGMEIEMEASGSGPLCRGTGRSVTCTSRLLYESNLENIGLSSWLCGPVDKVSDYQSGDYRFESC